MSNNHRMPASSKRSQAKARTPRPEPPSNSFADSDISDIPVIHPHSTRILYAAFIPPERTLSSPSVIGFLVVGIAPVTATSTPAIERGISYGKFEEFPDVSPPIPGRTQNPEAKERVPVPHNLGQDSSLRQDNARMSKFPDSSGTSPIEPLTPEYASYLGSAGIQDFQTGGLAEIGRHVFAHLQREAGVEIDVWGRGEMHVKPHMSQSTSHLDSEYPLLVSYPVPWEWSTLIDCRPPSLKQTPFSGEEELFPVDL
ncbi:hypothetical protein BKA70DRAFT_1523382 [Coprinopsis sp. MPI-PUGE-AT-0042]|nr:hypothetical protein BKA70DRAFT_1523382 [Coprinopsis sp. MPI-PUGE-AT-0042]